MKDDPVGTGPPVDAAAFEKMRRIARGLGEARRALVEGGPRTADLPEEVAFKLTNRCDLRCAHCYQWNDGGYHRGLAPGAKGGDLDLAIVERVLEATRVRKSNVILWGGEPLVYRHWDGLVGLLAEDPRWTSICTNGTLVGKRLDSLCRISGKLEVSISIDGFEPEHDALRGHGSYRRAMEGVALLAQRRREGAFEGEITVNFVVTDPMVARIADFLDLMADAGVQTVYVSLPWFLSADAAGRMDRYFARHFAWPPQFARPSWYSYGFGLDAAQVQALARALAALREKPPRLKVRYNPQLAPDELAAFVAGSHVPAQGKTHCQSIHSRMDVFPDGEVVSCKFFPEFRVGSLVASSVAEVWKGERFRQVRETVARCGLMPVCAKCPLLYTRGA